MYFIFCGKLLTTSFQQLKKKIKHLCMGTLTNVHDLILVYLNLWTTMRSINIAFLQMRKQTQRDEVT